MKDMRRQKRYPYEIKLGIEGLYKQDNVEIADINKDVILTDISRSGIGFSCSSQLPIDYYFNANITFDNKKHFYCVVKIIRCDERNGIYHYGCEFVGLADVLSIMVEEYGSEIDE